jgi:hypothetical protein
MRVNQNGESGGGGGVSRAPPLQRVMVRNTSCSVGKGEGMSMGTIILRCPKKKLFLERGLG